MSFIPNNQIGDPIPFFSNFDDLNTNLPPATNPSRVAWVEDSNASNRAGFYKSDGTEWFPIAQENSGVSKVGNSPLREAFVDPNNGDDTNRGTLLSPFATITKAMDYLQINFGDNAWKTVYIIADGFVSFQDNIFINTPNWHFEPVRFDVNGKAVEASEITVYINRRPSLGGFLEVSSDRGVVVITNMTKAAWDAFKYEVDGPAGVAPKLFNIDTVAGTWDYVGPAIETRDKVPPTSINANTGFYNMNISFGNINFAELSENVEELVCPIYCLFGRDPGNFDYVQAQNIKFAGSRPTGSSIPTATIYGGAFMNVSGIIFEDLNSGDRDMIFHNAKELFFKGSNRRGPQDTPVYTYLSDTAIQDEGTLPPSSFDTRGRLFGAHGPGDMLLFRNLHIFSDDVNTNQYVDELKAFNFGTINTYGVANLAADPRDGTFETIHRSRKIAARDINHTGTGRMNTYEIQCLSLNKTSSGDTLVNEINVEGDALLSSGIENVVRGGTIGGNLTVEGDATFDISGVTIRGDLIINGALTTGVFNDMFVAGDIVINTNTTQPITFNGGGYMGNILDETATPWIPPNFTRNLAN